MVELGDVLKPGQAETDRFTPERGTELDPGNIFRFVPVKDPSGRIADARRPGSVLTGGGGSSGGRGGTGGGGGRGRPSLSPLQQLAKKEAEQRVKREAEEKRKAAEQSSRDREEARQKRIEAGTIAGQIEAQEPSVDVFRAEDFAPGQRFRRGALETTGAFFQEVGRDIGIVATGILAGRDITGLRDPFDVFQFAGAQKGETVIIEPQFGTITEEFPKGVRETTLFQLQAAAQREAGIPEQAIGLSGGAQAAAIAGQESRRITRKFQEQIDVGQLGLEEAQLEARAEFGDVFTGRTGKIRADDLTVRSGKLFGDIGRQVAITGVVLGAAAVSPAIAGAVGGTSLAAAGQLSVRAGQEFGRGEFLQSGISLGQSALFGFGGASLITGALGPTGTIPRQITQSRLAQLEAQQVKLLGVEFVTTPKESVSIIGGLRQTAVARQQLEFLTPTFRTGTTAAGRTRASIVGGRGISRTQVLEFGAEGLVPAGRDILRSTQTFSFTARGVSGLPTGIRTTTGGLQLTTKLGEDITGGFGSLDLIRGEARTRAAFSGISKREGQIISVITGRPIKGTVQFEEVFTATREGLFGTSRAGVTQVSGRQLLFRPQAEGTILRLDLSKSLGDAGKQIGFRGGGAGTSLVQRQVSELGGTGLQAVTKISQIIKPTVDLGTGTTAVGGLTVTQRQFGDIGRQFGETSVFTGQLIQPRTRQISDVLVIPKQKTTLESLTGQRGRTAFIPAVDVRQFTSTATDTSLLFKQPLKLKQRQVATTVGFDPGLFVPEFVADFGGPSIATGFLLPPVAFPTFPSGRRKTRKRRRLRERIAPSLTGITQFDLGDITGDPLKISTGVFGRLPTELRLVPRDLVGTRRTDFSSFGGFTQPRKRKSTRRKKK